MSAGSDGKPHNCILRFGARTIEFGVEGHFRPLLRRNVHDFQRKSSPIQTNGTAFILDHSIGQDNLQHLNEAEGFESYCKDLESMNHLYPSSLLSFADLNEALNSYQYQVRFMLHHLFEETGITPFNIKLLLVWCDETPDAYLHIIVDTLLRCFLLRSVVVVPDSLFCSLSSGVGVLPIKEAYGCLIIDFGWRFTRINVVYDNRVLMEHNKLTNRSACRVHYHLVNKLNDLKLDFEDIEKILMHIKDFNNYSANTLDIEGTSIKESFIINSVIETLFPTSDLNLEKDEQSPIDLIFQTLNEVPIDLKSTLKANIVITGGFSNINNFSNYVMSKLNSSIIDNEVTGIKSLGSWAGASLYSSLVLRTSQKYIALPEIRRDNYLYGVRKKDMH